MIEKCDCKSQYQDGLYGAGNRVHNEMFKDRAHIGWRCTVCGKEKLDKDGKKNAKPKDS